jgi:hypothetical protein
LKTARFGRFSRVRGGAGPRTKLDVYRELRVREIWFWKDGRILVHVLRGTRYETAAGSEALASIDLDQLASGPQPARRSATTEPHCVARSPGLAQSWPTSGLVVRDDTAQTN